MSVLVNISVSGGGGGGGGGNVTGPSVSVDDDIVTFDGITGHLIQDGGAKISDLVLKNAPITAGTNTKITYDTKGLVTGSAAAVLASADYVNQGTAVTVLHGNAAGNPAFGAVVEDDQSLSDVTTLDVSATKHGYAPKNPNDSTKFLNGQGAYTVPAGTFVIGGTTGQIQYNNAGVLGGFGSYNSGTGLVTLPAGVVVTGDVTPATSGGSNVGSASLPFGSHFLKSAGVIDFANGGFRITHSVAGAVNALTFQNPTAVTGDTRIIIKRGAGGGVANLLDFQTETGVGLTLFDGGGRLAFGGGAQRPFISSTGLIFGSGNTSDYPNNGVIRFSSTTDGGGAKDAGISRNAAGILEVNSGTAGTIRTLLAILKTSTAATTGLGPGVVAALTDSTLQITDSTGQVYRIPCII